MIESQNKTLFYCDGPNCEVEVTTTDPPSKMPTGWLTAYGPSEHLGEFHFHSGACYDNWRLNVENAVAARQQTQGAIANA